MGSFRTEAIWDLAPLRIQLRVEGEPAVAAVPNPAVLEGHPQNGGFLEARGSFFSTTDI